MAKAATAGVHLHEKVAGIHFALQLYEVISATKAAELLHAAFWLSLSAPGYYPVIIDGNAMTLGAAAIESRTVLCDVMLRAATHQTIEFAFRQIPQAMTLAARAHFNALHYCAIELPALLWSRGIDEHFRLRAHHAAPNVVTNRSHSDCATFIIGYQHATDRDAVAIVDIRSDHNHLHSGEARGVDDLFIKDVFGAYEQLLREKQTHRNFGGIFRLQNVVAITMPARQMLPAMRVGEGLRRAQCIYSFSHYPDFRTGRGLKRGIHT